MTDPTPAVTEAEDAAPASILGPLDLLAANAEAVAELVDEALTGLSLRAVLGALDAADRATESLFTLRAAVSAVAARMMPEDNMTVDGVTYDRWGNGWTRKGWDNGVLREAIRGALVRRLLDPDGTGEAPAPYALALVNETLDAAEAVVSVSGSNAKIGGLRGLGLDPDRYCEREAAPVRVRVTRHQAPNDAPTETNPTPGDPDA